MSALIEELKKEHSEIVATLNEVKKLGILSKEGQAKLLSVKESLLAHLNKEDGQLYPALKKGAEHNKDLKNTLDLFAMDMENVSSVALEFYDKYSEGALGEEFAREFEKLFAAINSRIRHEEEVLYDEYEYMNKPGTS
ncbi:MAG: hemerythrin domain-containing protein [Candidatus Scalinduaceae bacterium]